MPQGELSFHVARPPQVVFDFLSDLERASEWAPILSEMEKRTPGKIGVGSLFGGRVTLAGQTESGELEITTFERPDVFAYEGRGGPARFTARFELQATGEGTQVEHRYTLELSGFAKMMAPMLAGVLDEKARSAVDALCRAIEDS